MAAFLRAIGLSGCIPHLQRENKCSPLRTLVFNFDDWLARKTYALDVDALVVEQVQWLDRRMQERIFQLMDELADDKERWLHEYEAEKRRIKDDHLVLLDFIYRTGPLPREWFECKGRQTPYGIGWHEQREMRERRRRRKTPRGQTSVESVDVAETEYTAERMRVHEWTTDVHRQQHRNKKLEWKLRWHRIFRRRLSKDTKHHIQELMDRAVLNNI